MSAMDTDPRAAGHHGDEEELDHDTLHISVGGYVTGFVLSVILTAIPFWLVMDMVFFLHMTSKAEGGWTWMSLIFMVVLVVITLSGSLWVMYHLKTNMTLPSPEQMRNIP